MGTANEDDYEATEISDDLLNGVAGGAPKGKEDHPATKVDTPAPPRRDTSPKGGGPDGRKGPAH